MRSTGRRCFLISPIGDEGSPERAHADDVYEFIVKPAMDQCSIEVIRSDRVHAPTSSVYQLLVQDFQALWSLNASDAAS